LTLARSELCGVSPDGSSPDGILAQHSISRPGSLDPDLPLAASAPDSELNLLELTEIPLPEQLTALAPAPVPAISADLLNDIVERARISTNASNAAIALRHGDDLICFATTGANAPDIGVRLDLNAGLSGVCVQSRKFQRCDDSETDGRIDAQLCRRLGIRSVLVFPVIRHDALLGVVEVFSPQPNAFDDREVQALATLSRTVGYILDRPVEAPAAMDEFAEVADLRAACSAAATPTEEAALDLATLPAHSFGRSFETIPEFPDDFSLPLDPVAEEQKVDDLVSATEGPDTTAAPSSAVSCAAEPAKVEQQTAPVIASKQDSYSPMLTVAVIALAVALGWLLGESVERQSAPIVQNRAPAATVPLQPPAPALAHPNESNNPASKPAERSARKHQPDSAKGEADASVAAAPDELVVSQNGKVIYRQEARPALTQAPSPVPAPTQGAVPAGISRAAIISPARANQYLVKRVEPEYPEPARESNVSGPVTLEAIVAKDGSIKTIKTISGDPQLVAAARQAVSQWRFKPFTQQGKPAEFQTNVTVNFRLPN
jgi:TonB family protein